MATCVRTDRKVEIVKIEKEIQPESYTLTLNRKQVEALLLLFRSVGGDPEKTPRGDTDQINRALWGSISNAYPHDNYIICKGFYTSGSIYFKEHGK